MPAGLANRRPDMGSMAMFDRQMNGRGGGMGRAGGFSDVFSNSMPGFMGEYP